MDPSVVLGCMSQLWEKNMKYDDADTLMKAVEEVTNFISFKEINEFPYYCAFCSQFKRLYTPKGSRRG